MKQNINYSNQFPKGSRPQPKVERWNVEVHRTNGTLEQTLYINGSYRLCAGKKKKLKESGIAEGRIKIVPAK